MNTNLSRGIGFLCLALCLVLSQLWFISRKVWEIDSTSYSNAVELKVTRAWRYGYYLGHHGATLVKTRNLPDAVPEGSCSDSIELCAIMHKELGLVPIKAFLELTLYIGILGYVFFATHWAREHLISKQRGRIWRSLVEGSFWIIGWTLMLLPLVILGYGLSVYTNWEGPGALSSSGLYVTVMLIPGMTVSYRSLVEVVAFVPITVFDAIGITRLFYGVPLTWALWAVGTLFFGIIGFIVGTVKTIATCRRDHREDAAS